MIGGYDEGYRACPCFWGRKPGSLIAKLITRYDFAGKRVLDLGCGEGKNAAVFARAGAVVTAVDCSELAVSHGQKIFGNLDISWIVDDALDFLLRNGPYDIVIMYGLLHCLSDREAIFRLIERAKASTAKPGMHILVAFNDRSQDLVHAHPRFHPTLLPHAAYLESYSEHDIVIATDTILEETHPHNSVPHHHSMTRIVVKIG